MNPEYTDRTHVPSFYYSELRHEKLQNLFERSTPQDFFQAAGGNDWIKRTVVTDMLGSFDLDATAQSLGFPVGSHSLFEGDAGRISGLHEIMEIPIEISLAEQQTTASRRHTFGHELGHYFLFTQGVPQHYDFVHRPDDFQKRIEAFCEYFGMQVVLPLEALKDIEYVDEATLLELATKYDTEYDLVTLQLMQAEKLPKVIFFDTLMLEGSKGIYADKVRRQTICFDCQQGIAHRRVREAPIYNFTDVRLLSSMVEHECTVSIINLKHLRELNKAYDNWTEEDEIEYERKMAKSGLHY